MYRAKVNTYLIAYDITAPRRLARLHYFLKKRSVAVQYSLFLAQLNAREFNELLEGVRARIEPREDDVRVYRLPHRLQAWRLGRDLLPEGVLLTGGKLAEAIGGTHGTKTAHPARDMQLALGI